MGDFELREFTVSVDLTATENLDAALPARVRCAGPASPGFSLTRHAGVTARHDVSVHDQRVRLNAAAEGVCRAIAR